MDGCRLFRYVILLTMVVGIQDQQCPVGFYGSRCQHTCPRNCNSQLCNTDKFGRTVCTHGCVDGYRGTSCKIPCPVNCRVCERLNGSCINCKDTFHGTNCTLTCEELCQGFRCDTDQTCSETMCLDGRYGQNCSNKCSPRYLTCGRSTGDCTACRDGYYGEFCELDCPRCGFKDGSVDHTCKDGCNTISCSDITCGDCGRNTRLTVCVPVVLLLVIAIAVILCLWWRSHNKIIRKERETEEEVQQRMLEEKHTKSRKKRETEEEVQQRMPEEKHLKSRKKRETDEEVQQRMPEEKHLKSRKKRETEEEVQQRMSEEKHLKSRKKRETEEEVQQRMPEEKHTKSQVKRMNQLPPESSNEEIGGPAFFTSGSEHSLVTTNYDDDGSNYITIHSNICVCVDSKD